MLGNAYLILENGAVFEGRPFGYDSEAVGKLVFTTKMTGYLETLSDPAYYGQIVLQTFPLIGNYGVIPRDFGPGPMHLKAYIVRQWCQEPSNFRSEGNLDSFLCDHKIPGLYGIDTRSLTRVIRENGSLNAMISGTAELSGEQWAALRGYRVAGAVAAACADSNFSPGVYPELGIRNEELGIEDAEGRMRVALWDFGDGFRASRLLLRHGCVPAVAGHGMTAEGILANSPDGVMLSGGPGDPAENPHIIDEIRKLCVLCKERHIPVFAVGLGHQMLALANGAAATRLKFGNRGANVPVLEHGTGRAFITEQNHGFTVISDSLPENAAISHSNINDGTCEGIEYAGLPAFSVQFTPTDSEMRTFTDLISRDTVGNMQNK